MVTEKQLLVDVHSHSNLSSDGIDEPMDMAKRAAEIGVTHFALTDHIELDEFGDEEWDYWAAIEKTKPAFEQIKSAYGDKMHVYYAAEIGQALYDLPTTEKILAEHDYDFIIGSVHRTVHYAHMSKIPDTEYDRTRVLKEYFDEMVDLVEWGQFSTLAHMTFLMRFINIDVPGQPLVKEKSLRSKAVFETYKTVIDKILQTIIKKDIALEANSSGYRRGLGGPMASPEIIARYRELGGKLVTVGSDAHDIGDIGKDIPQTFRLLKEIGFKEIAVFEKKQPIMLQIPDDI